MTPETPERGGLPESVRNELTLAHAESCQCETWGEPQKGSRCFEVREILEGIVLTYGKSEYERGLRDGKPAGLDEALNSGDGAYRP